MKDLKANSKFVYSIDIDKAAETAGGRRDVQNKRALSRQDALALKTDYDVWNENKRRFKKILSAARVENNEYDKDFKPAMERVSKIMAEWLKNNEKYIDDGRLEKPRFKTLSKKSYHRQSRGKGYTSSDNNILMVQQMLISAYSDYISYKDDSSGSEYGAKLAKLSKAVLNDNITYSAY
jgi:hypothetical protein